MMKKMNKSYLGSTGLEVSQISFGTVSLGLPYGIRIERESAMPSESGSIALLREALDRGVNFFDTALSYGKSEMIVGEAFWDCRDKAIICTKPAHLYDPFAGQSLPLAHDVKTMLQQSLEQSLKRLNTDYIDVYMSHDGTEEVIENETVIDFYQSLKKKGIIKATGVSVYTVQQSLKAIQTGMWDVIQLAFNMLDQTQLPAIQLAAQKNVGIIVRSVLFKGILTEKGDSLHPALNSVQNHRLKYLQLLNDQVKTLSDLATRFVLSYEGVSSVLVGIDKPVYLDRALGTLQQGKLYPEIIEKIKDLTYPDPEFLDLPRWDRMGWL